MAQALLAQDVWALFRVEGSPPWKERPTEMRHLDVRRRRGGFTLVEMLVLIGVFGILVALSLPSFSKYLRSNRLGTTADRLAADLHLTRSTAIANGRIYRLVANAEGYTIIDPATEEVLRDRQYEGDVALAAEVVVNFFPWGMADPASLILSNDAGDRTIDILPTGMVEVH